MSLGSIREKNNHFSFEEQENEEDSEPDQKRNINEKKTTPKTIKIEKVEKSPKLENVGNIFSPKIDVGSPQ